MAIQRTCPECGAHVPLGWLMRLDFGVFVAGIFWFVVLLMGVAAAWLILGTLLGWPLMWGALSADREGDAFDAFSRRRAPIGSAPPVVPARCDAGQT